MIDLTGSTLFVLIRRRRLRPGEGQVAALLRWPGGLDVVLEWADYGRVKRGQAKRRVEHPESPSTCQDA